MQLSNVAKPLTHRRTLMLAIASALALGFTGQASAQAFPASINLGSLNGANGFRLDGAAMDFSGVSVSDAGDFNGDGIDDLIIGAPGADPNGSSPGSSYIVYGKRTPFAATFALSSLNGANGFRFDGAMAGDDSGAAVSAAGDVNGDGFDDVIIGAPGVKQNNSQFGASYVLFGAAGQFPSTISPSNLSGRNGFALTGEDNNTGYSVSAAGDVNGDGFGDVIVGTRPDIFSAGKSYVIFGKSSGFAASQSIVAVNGTNGFRIVGPPARSVSNAGDVNGDGVDDLIVGTVDLSGGNASGRSFVVFGKTTAFPTTLDVFSLDGTNGFRIDGVSSIPDQAGLSVSAAGDVNGDGIGDLIIGTIDSGRSYVIFGRNTPFSATLSLTSLNGSNGFWLIDSMYSQGFRSVSAAGDVNSDGFDDVIIGNRLADQLAGKSYVVFGKGTPFPASIDLSNLTGTNGFRLNGAMNEDYSGASVSAAGDVNGDGVNDLIVGARGTDFSGANSGSSYVVFGRDTGAFKNGFE